MFFYSCGCIYSSVCRTFMKISLNFNLTLKDNVNHSWNICRGSYIYFAHLLLIWWCYLEWVMNSRGQTRDWRKYTHTRTNRCTQPQYTKAKFGLQWTWQRVYDLLYLLFASHNRPCSLVAILMMFSWYTPFHVDSMPLFEDQGTVSI